MYGYVRCPQRKIETAVDANNSRYVNRQSGAALSRGPRSNVAQGVRRQYQVGVEGNGQATVPQPRGNSVDVQAALQPVAGSAVAQAWEQDP